MESNKSALARTVEVKMKGINPQMAVGDIAILDVTLRNHVRYANAAVDVQYKFRQNIINNNLIFSKNAATIGHGLPTILNIWI